MKKVLCIVVIVIIVGTVGILGLNHFGIFSFLGDGGGGTRGPGSSVASEDPKHENTDPLPEPTEESHISEILIEGDQIFFDGELCASADILKQNITRIGTEKEYQFTYTNAIKGTYDEVNAVLTDLKNVLGIIVHEQ